MKLLRIFGLGLVLLVVVVSSTPTSPLKEVSAQSMVGNPISLASVIPSALAATPGAPPSTGDRGGDTWQLYLPFMVTNRHQPTLTPTATATPPPTPTATATPTAPGSTFPEVTDAVYTHNGDVTTITIPSTACSMVSSSPIQVGDFVVWGMNDHLLSGCSPHSPYYTALLGYHVRTGRLYRLAQSGSSEATLLYRPDAGLAFQNVVFGGSAVSALDANTFQKVYGTPQTLRTTSDASGVYLNGLYYFGTINTPERTCQQPINPNCGAVFALDANGNIVYSLNLDDGFRSWVGAGLTTDGQFVYVGGSPQVLGDSESQYLYGCSVVKLDPQLHILAAFDPGVQGCHRSGAGRNDEDAVAGEVVIAGDGTLWVDFTHGVDDRNVFALYHLDANLNPLCVFEGPSSVLPLTGYYQSPTVDKDGNVYVHISPNGLGTNSTGQLWKVTPTCQGTKLADLPQGGSSTPVLADDQYVLSISAGQLQVRTVAGHMVRTYPLATQASVIASPMIADGVIYIVDTTGALTVIRNSGLHGYGAAPWPRYRHDNLGSAVQQIGSE